MKTTTLPRHELIIDRASNLVSMDEYVHRVKDLVRASIQYDPTLVLHSDDAIAGKYHHSMVIMEGDHMIANTSIYPTSMKPLDTLLDTNGNPITVGECGSTVVDIEKRYSGI